MSINKIDNEIALYEKYKTKKLMQNNADSSIFEVQQKPDVFQTALQDYQEDETIDTTSLKQNLEKTKSEQGFLGKLWDGFKNLTGIGAGSSKAQQAIEDYEKGLITTDEMQKAVNGYKEGQKMVVDVVADMASGMLSIIAFGAATAFLGPMGGLLVAGGVGAISKVGIKATDTAFAGREYSNKDLLYDSITGGINGLLGPITNGIGNTVTKTIATKFGLSLGKSAAKQAGKQGFKQFAKNVILNQTDDFIGGTLKQRAIALGTGMAVDGALGGASDNMIRAGLEGKNILRAGAEGFIGGLAMAPIIGSGMKLGGKGARALNNKITTSRVLSKGMKTKFKQGLTGNCALLSTIDSMMNSKNAAGKIKKAITRTPFGDYNVKIGDEIVRVSKKSLTDEALSDTTGIKLFEIAYKQIDGSIDGEFAEVVAKQFGLNPIHITSEGITDELLERISKDSDNLVLSLGMDKHYYSIKSVDPQTKIVTLTDSRDASKAFTMSFDEVKAKGVSIDGGSVKKTGLPDVKRNADGLFPDGVENLKFYQRGDGTDLNNCHFLSSLKAISLNEKAAQNYLAKSISVGDDGFYRVKFYDKDKWVEVVLSPEEVSKGIGGHNVGTKSQGIKVIETAYAKLKDPKNFMNQTQAISGKTGIQAFDDLYALTGNKPFTITAATRQARIKESAFPKVAEEFLDEYAKRQNDFIVVVGTKCSNISGAQNAIGDNYTFIPGHAYTLADVDSLNRTVTVIDPYDSTISHTISYDYFTKLFNEITGIDFTEKYNTTAQILFEKYKPTSLFEK